jgi:hypothetical protein
MICGKVLGRGGFCVVNEVTKIKLMKKYERAAASNGIESASNDQGKNGDKDRHDEEHILYHVVQDRSFMEEYCLRGKTKDCRYAIKRMQDSCYSDPSIFINAIVDLAVEARFLSVLKHANIIKMRAMAITSPYDSNFFVVLDRLYDILTTRIVKWKKIKPPTSGLKKVLMDRSGKKETALWAERCLFAFDLSCALKFLHGKQ